MLSNLLFDAIAITNFPVVRFFESQRSAPLAGSEHIYPDTTILTERAHSNNPRSGLYGLPKQWAVKTSQLRVVSNANLPAAFDEAQLFFRVNGVEVFHTTLGALLNGPQKANFTIPQMTPFHGELILPLAITYASPLNLSLKTPFNSFDVDAQEPTGKAIAAWPNVKIPVLWLVLEGECETVVI